MPNLRICAACGKQKDTLFLVRGGMICRECGKNPGLRHTEGAELIWLNWPVRVNDRESKGNE